MAVFRAWNPKDFNWMVDLNGKKHATCCFVTRYSTWDGLFVSYIPIYIYIHFNVFKGSFTRVNIYGISAILSFPKNL